MYKYDEKNFNQYVVPKINKYVKRLLIVFVLSIILLYLLLNKFNLS